MHKVTVIGYMQDTKKRLVYIVSDAKDRRAACRLALREAGALGLKKPYVEDALWHIPPLVDLLKVEDA